MPAETHAFPGPIPTQIVSSDEYMPDAPDARASAEVEARTKALGDELARQQGVSRRAFFQTAAGMAAAFVAMNEVYGPLYDVSRAEAQTPDDGQGARAGALRPVRHGLPHALPARRHAHHELRARSARRSARPGWNPALAGKPQTIEDLKFANYFKEIYLDSDTKVALISGSPSDVPQDWFLTNEMKAEARAKVNREAGSRRMLSHAIFTPGQPGWLEAVDRAIAELKPDSFKGYTIGDNTNKADRQVPVAAGRREGRLPGYEKFAKAGLVNVCVHKGLFPPSVEKQFPHLLAYSDVRDVGQAAKDWPQLNFIIYHSAYRFAGRRHAGRTRGRSSSRPGASSG